MKENPRSIRYEKKHAFFALEEEKEPTAQKAKYIAKIPGVIGKQVFPSFSSRFGDNDYRQQIDRQEFEKMKSLIFKVQSIKFAPRTYYNLKRQILYIGRLSTEFDQSLSLQLEGEKSVAPITECTKLYDQNFNIVDKEDVERVAASWTRDFKKNEANSRHIFLSIGGKEDRNKTLAVTKLFLEDVFKSKGFDYFFAGHFDTENDHFHVIIKKKNNLGQNLRFNKNDIFLLRQKYGNYLETVGIKRQILARKDQKHIIQKVEDREEHLKNDNTWYQSKLNKGNQKDFNAYNYKANLTGRIEEIINFLTVKNYLKTLGAENENLANRLKPNIRKNGLKVTMDSLLAVKQMQDKKVKIENLEGLIIQAVEKNFKPSKPKVVIRKESGAERKIFVPELSQNEIQDKFKEAAINHFAGQRTIADLQKHLDKALVQAAAKSGAKIRFGDKNNCEMVWYGEGGYILDYRGGEIFKWSKNKIKYDANYSYKELSKEELERQNQEQKIAREKLEFERKELAIQVATKAQNLFSKYNDSKENALSYLKKKGIEDLDIPGVKFQKGNLVVPAKDIDGKIWSLQYIAEDSTKKFLKNSKLQGNFFVLQDQNKSTKRLEEEGTIFLVEGFATGATINKATGCNVVVCFNSGNLKDVLSNLVSKFPEKKFVIAADNDLWGKINTGKEKAEEAALQHRGKVDVKIIVPKFSYEHKDLAPTDFNDLQELSGIDEVRKQVLEGMMRKTEIKVKKQEIESEEKDQMIIDSLKKLKAAIFDSEDKTIIKNRVDETIKHLQIINEKTAIKISEEINNDEVRYSYVQPKKEVKMNNEKGLKI